MDAEVRARRPRKDKHAPTYPFKETVKKVLLRVCDKLEKLLTTSPEQLMLLFGAAAHPLIFVTEIVSNCGESVIEHLTGDPKEQSHLIDVIFSWFGKIARGGQYPLLAQHLDLWKAIKAQRREDIQRIQAETPEYITVHLVKIDKDQQDIYKSKLVSFNGSTPLSTTKDPVMDTNLLDHHLILDGHTERNKIDIHAVIDCNTIPPDLYQKIDRKMNRSEKPPPTMVENVIKRHYTDYPRTHRISELVRDWVIDLDSPEMKAWFEENEWQQITSAFPTLPEQPEQLQTFLNRFSEVLLLHRYWRCSIMRLISISR
jgi:hypothetical protein